MAIAARTYYMTMLFNLNMRGENSLTMPDPSLSHITTQLRTRPGQSVGGTNVIGTVPHDKTIYIGRGMSNESHEVSSCS